MRRKKLRRSPAGPPRVNRVSSKSNEKRYRDSPGSGSARIGRKRINSISGQSSLHSHSAARFHHGFRQRNVVSTGSALGISSSTGSADGMVSGTGSGPGIRSFCGWGLAGGFTAGAAGAAGRAGGRGNGGIAFRRSGKLRFGPHARTHLAGDGRVHVHGMSDGKTAGRNLLSRLAHVDFHAPVGGLRILVPLVDTYGGKPCKP